MQIYPLDDQQHATVLAALRYYQLGHQGDPKMREDMIHTIATNMDSVVSLDDDGIDALIDQLQDGEPPEMSPIQKLCWDNLNHDRSDLEAEDIAFIKEIDAIVQASLPSLDEWKKEFDTRLAALSDEDLRKSFADMGVDVVVRRSSLPSLDDITLPGDDDEPCRECEAPTDDGEGYDGKCGNCADREYAEDHCTTCGDELEEDSYEGLCSDCAEKEVEAQSRRGMAANPKEELPTRTFAVPEGCSGEVGAFVVTENEPDSPQPPCEWVAWRILRAWTDDGHRKVDCVMDLEASEAASLGTMSSAVREWTNITRGVGDA